MFRTQTRVEQTVQFRNTPLSAAFAVLPPATNGDLLFAVAASAANIARIELFSTGGSIAVSTNQAAAELAASAATLGLGLHPFHAVVTDASSHQYQTPTVWEQVPALQLSLIGPPQALSWPAIAGRQVQRIGRDQPRRAVSDGRHSPGHQCAGAMADYQSPRGGGLLPGVRGAITLHACEAASPGCCGGENRF